MALSRPKTIVVFALITGFLLMRVPVSDAQATPVAAEVTANVHLRKGPGTQFGIRAGVTQGSRVRVIKEKNGWIRVQLSIQGLAYSGWILGRYLRSAPSGTTPPNGPLRDIRRTVPRAVGPHPGAAPNPPPSKPAAQPVKGPLVNVVSPTTGTTVVSTTSTMPTPPAPPAATPVSSAPLRPPTPAPVPSVARVRIPAPASIGRLPSPSPARIPWPWAAAVAFVSAVMAVIALILSLRAMRIAGRYRDLAAEYETFKSRRADTFGRVDDKRRHRRAYRFVEVDFSINGRFYHGLIDNVCASGAFIETSGTFAVNDAVTLSYPAPTAEGNIKRQGMITRIAPTGIAVAFSDDLEPV